MQHKVETITGKGTVTLEDDPSEEWSKMPVDYELEIWQEQISTPLMGNPSASVPGMKQIRGWIHPQCCAVGDIATLELNDGRKLKFFYVADTSDEIQWF
jgi:hypothetical protein